MKQVTISDQAGDTLKTIPFKGEPLELSVAALTDDKKGAAGGGSFKREVCTGLRCVVPTYSLDNSIRCQLGAVRFPVAIEMVSSCAGG